MYATNGRTDGRTKATLIVPFLTDGCITKKKDESVWIHRRVSDRRLVKTVMMGMVTVDRPRG